MFISADEAILSRAVASAENALPNAAQGYSRFPGISTFATLSGTRTFLVEWNGDLYAATDEGRVYRISRDGVASDITGVPLAGGKRVMFEAGEDRLLMAAGGPIIEVIGGTTQRLASTAPETTHVAYIDSYLLAIEQWSNRFQHSPPGEPTVWNDIDVFSANAKAAPITAMLVTPYRELLLAGPRHIEQFERLPNGNQPFSRRWTTGQGVLYPYTLVADETGTYGINGKHEFVRFAGQVAQEHGEAIGMLLANIDDWTDAWAQSLSIDGEPSIVLQAPFATNPYGTQGVTLHLQLRGKRWNFLYGWDSDAAVPARYPAWSFVQAWGRTYVGIPGGVGLLSQSTFTNMGEVSPFLIRSGHLDKFGPSRIDDLRIRLKRGVGSRTADRAPLIGLRVNRDNEGFDQWNWEPLGVQGDGMMIVHFGPQGCADTWQFEIRITDPVAVEFVSMQIHVERLSW